MTNESNDMNQMDEFEQSLSAFDEEFEAADGKNSFEDVPDGKYNAVIASSVCKMSKNGRPMWTVEYAIVGGKYNGRRIFKNQMLDNAMGAKITKQDCTTCGVELEKFSELRNHMNEFLDLACEITQKTTKKDGNEYVNVYLNKCTGKSEGGIPSASGGGAGIAEDDFDGDKLPF